MVDRPLAERRGRTKRRARYRGRLGAVPVNSERGWRRCSPLDSFGGGFTVSAFVAYWLRARFDASPAVIGATFFAIGLLQTVSFLVAPRLADRFGLLPTMVFTHLPSNLLLAVGGLRPQPGRGVVLLLARTALSQMDVPTRQAYVMALVDPG